MDDACPTTGDSHMRRLITSQRGFSLVEAMVAFGILAVGMMAVGTMITTSMQFEKRSIGKREAYSLAMEKFEELKGDYVETLGPSVAAIEEDVEQWVGDTRRVTGFRRKSEFQSADAPTACCVRCEQVAAAVWACAYKVKITVGWGDTAACTKSDPSQCPNRSVFINYVVIRKADSTCPVVANCP